MSDGTSQDWGKDKGKHVRENTGFEFSFKHKRHDTMLMVISLEE